MELDTERPTSGDVKEDAEPSTSTYCIVPSAGDTVVSYG